MIKRLIARLTHRDKEEFTIAGTNLTITGSGPIATALKAQLASSQNDDKGVV